MSDTVNSSSCSYVSLNNYNSSSAGMLGSPPERETRPSTVRGYYIVPDYKPIQYNALTHGNAGPSCSGYFNITNGYGADAANCDTKYDFSPCVDGGGGDIKEGFKTNQITGINYNTDKTIAYLLPQEHSKTRKSSCPNGYFVKSGSGGETCKTYMCDNTVKTRVDCGDHTDTYGNTDYTWWTVGNGNGDGRFANYSSLNSAHPGIADFRCCRQTHGEVKQF